MSSAPRFAPIFGITWRILCRAWILPSGWVWDVGWVYYWVLKIGRVLIILWIWTVVGRVLIVRGWIRRVLSCGLGRVSLEEEKKVSLNPVGGSSSKNLKKKINV